MKIQCHNCFLKIARLLRSIKLCDRGSLYKTKASSLTLFPLISFPQGQIVSHLLLLVCISSVFFFILKKYVKKNKSLIYSIKNNNIEHTKEKNNLSDLLFDHKRSLFLNNTQQKYLSHDVQSTLNRVRNTVDDVSNESNPHSVIHLKLKAVTQDLDYLLRKVDAFSISKTDMARPDLNAITSIKLNLELINLLKLHTDLADLKGVNLSTVFDIDEKLVFKINKLKLKGILDIMLTTAIGGLKTNDSLSLYVNDKGNIIEIILSQPSNNISKESLIAFGLDKHELPKNKQIDYYEHLIGFGEIKKIVESMNGQFSYESTNEKLSVIVNLPRIEVLVFEEDESSMDIIEEDHVDQENLVVYNSVDPGQGNQRNGPELNEEDKSWLLSIESFILENIQNNKLSISWLAKEFNMSESTLRRQINSFKGMSPIKYLQELRLNLAYDMINNKKFKSVTRISNEVGYSDLSTFSRLFRKRYGISPSKLLKE